MKELYKLDMWINCLQQGTRIENLATTVRNYITDSVQDGFSVGIVIFDNIARTLADIQMITGQEVRSVLLAAVPSSAGGGTSIGAGLLECQQVSFNIMSRDMITGHSE